jgi:hypothetical protein
MLLFAISIQQVLRPSGRRLHQDLLSFELAFSTAPLLFQKTLKPSAERRLLPFVLSRRVPREQQTNSNRPDTAFRSFLRIYCSENDCWRCTSFVCNLII